MKQRRKKKRHVRQKDWTTAHEDAFSHDLKRHRRTDSALPPSATSGPLPEDIEANGVVVSHSKKWAVVLLEGGETLCRIAETIVEDDSTILAPGDEVLVEGEGDEAVVRGVKVRRTKLSRLAIEHARVSEQVVAANVDQLLIVAAAARPPIRAGLIDRYLVSAQMGGVTPVVCINKMDLVDKEPDEAALYADLGVEVLLTSCETGLGMEAFRKCLENKISVLAGHSGVGKSSLLNVLDPALDIETTTISEVSKKGRHTTSGSRLYSLAGNIRIIDTPGIRQLGLWNVSEEEIGWYFPDLAGPAGQCRFRDCTHVHEPECAVREAVESGDIKKQRYASYLRIRASIEEKKTRH